jgi:hypothetical protein
MGIDLYMCAIPLNCEPMVEIRGDERLWESACAQPPFFWHAHRRLPMPEINRRLLAEMPDDRDMTWDFPDRSFHQLEYLLDPVGYRRLNSYEEREQTLPYQVVQGDQPFAWFAPGWRCSTNEFLSIALMFLDEFDPAAVRPEFSNAAMWDRGIYKTRPDEDDDATFVTLLNHLGELTRYYQRVVAAGLDAIVIRW